MADFLDAVVLGDGEQAVLAICANRLYRHKVPVRVQAIEAFPVTHCPNGTKIQKHALQKNGYGPDRRMIKPVSTENRCGEADFGHGRLNLTKVIPTVYVATDGAVSFRMSGRRTQDHPSSED